MTEKKKRQIHVRPEALEKPLQQDAPSSDLRQQAEAAVRSISRQEAPGRVEALSSKGMAQTRHELHVHQIELEMQNDELRRTKLDLDISQARYFDIFDLAPVGYCILNDQGEILDVNFTAAAMLGRPKSALQKRPLNRFILPADQDIYYTKHKALREFGTSQGCELRMLRKDNSVVWIRLNETITETDEHATPAYRTTLSDITELKQLERQKELLQEELYARAVASAAADRDKVEAARLEIAALKKTTIILDAVAVGVWESDLKTGVFVFDDTMYKLYGLTKAECPKPAAAKERAIHPDDRSRMQTGLMERIVAGESQLEASFRIIRPDGALRHLLAKIAVERTKDGIPIKVSGTEHDITALRESESQLRQTNEALYASTIVATTDRFGKITSVNDAFCEISGYSRAELVGQDHRMVNSGLHSKAFFQEMWATISAGSHWSGELRNRAKDGSHYWVQTTINPIKNAAGGIESYLALRSDITSVKESQLALARTAQRMRDAQRLGQVGSYFIDFIGHDDEMSEEAKRIFGFAPNEVCDANARRTRIHPDDRPAVLKAREQFIERDVPFDREYRLILPDGTIRHVLVRLQGTRDSDGRATSANGIVQDITSRKNMDLLASANNELRATQEKLRQEKRLADLSNATKGAFLANMSHEIRTPLGIMMGFADLLVSSDLADDKRQYAENIRRNGQNLLALINDILDLAKIEAKSVEIQCHAFELFPFMTDIMSQLNVKAMEKGVNLTLACKGRLPKVIETDDLRLRQILMNVVGNALKFTEHGEICVRLALNEGQAGTQLAASLLEIEVRDTGPGIAPENYEKVFRPFTQVDDVARRYGGTGLGLSLSAHLAKALGGDVQLKASEVGRGSTFVILVAPGDLSDVAMLSEAECQAMKLERKLPPALRTVARTLAGIRVLMVDDYEDNQELVRAILTRYGAIVDFAGNGQEGVTKACSGSYDVVLMDIQMPVMNGFEALEKLKKLRYSGAVIALTANAMKDDIDRCLAAGFTDYLAKPVNRATLHDMVMRYGGRTITDPGKAGAHGTLN